MQAPKVFVTRRWPSEVEAELAARYAVTLNESDRPLSADELMAALRDYDAVLPTVTDPLPASVLGVTPRRCRILGNFGVGYNHIDIDAARQAGIVVTNTPGVLTDCTADIAMLLLLMSAHRASEGERLVRTQAWTGWGPTQLLGNKVSGKTLGLVGFGRIAQAVARRAHHGFGMRILFFTPSDPDPAIVQTLQATRCASLEELLAASHFVSLHCPGGVATRHLIDARRLRLMRPDAHLINTARGDVVDSEALITALRERWIAGAGLDVYENEPNLHPDFLELENISLLPHLGSASAETRNAMGRKVLENIEAFFTGREPPDRVV